MYNDFFFKLWRNTEKNPLEHAMLQVESQDSNVN